MVDGDGKTNADHSLISKSQSHFVNVIIWFDYNAKVRKGAEHQQINCVVPLIYLIIG